MRYFPFIQETSTSDPTGALNQTIALTEQSGYGRFNEIPSITTDECFCVTIRQGDNWECGFWEYSAADTLKRVSVIAKLDTGTYSALPATGIDFTSSSKTVTLTNGAVLQAARAYYSGPTTKIIWAGDEPRPASTYTNTTTRLHVIPVTVRSWITATHMAFELTTITGTTTISVNAGIYLPGSYGGPGVRIAQMNAAFTTVAFGLKQEILAANVILSPGTYFLALIASHTGTAPIFRGNGSATLNHGLLGNNSSSGINVSIDAIYRAGSGSTLDASYTNSGWTSQSGAAVPCIGVMYA